MKKILIVFFIGITSCNNPGADKKVITVQDTAIIKDSLNRLRLQHNTEISFMWDTFTCGDIDFDKIPDSAFVYTPTAGDKGFEGCINNICDNRIVFSNHLPDINLQNSLWARIENIGDINKDGTCELIIRPDWFSSCWGNLYIYSLEKGQWRMATEVSARRCEEEPLISHIFKVKNKYFLEGDDFSDGDEKKYRVEIKL
ncbi:MAG: hypothetical protein V4613_12445 [Bacteroidota bacterium]